MSDPQFPVGGSSPNDDSATPPPTGHSHWNYRMVRRVEELMMPNGIMEVDDDFVIHEVYYEPNGDIRAYSAAPSYASGDTPQELADDIARMIAALSKAVLTYAELEAAVKGP